MTNASAGRPLAAASCAVERPLAAAIPDNVSPVTMRCDPDACALAGRADREARAIRTDRRKDMATTLPRRPREGTRRAGLGPLARPCACCPVQDNGRPARAGRAWRGAAARRVASWRRAGGYLPSSPDE